jgi:hypothetical protein
MRGRHQSPQTACGCSHTVRVRIFTESRRSAHRDSDLRLSTASSAIVVEQNPDHVTFVHNRDIGLGTERKWPSAAAHRSQGRQTKWQVRGGFLHKAIKHNGTAEKIMIDRSAASAIESYSTKHEFEHDAGIELRQIKYFNNIAGQNHRVNKRQTRPILTHKSFCQPP